MASNPRYQKSTPKLTPARGNAVAEAIRLEIVPVDAVVSALEREWGIGRLPALVSPATLIKFKAAREMWGNALAGTDHHEVVRLAPMIVRAWRALAAEASANGHAPLAPEVWEARKPDGTILAVVRDGYEAVRVARDNRELEVWTMAEVAAMADHYAQSVGITKMAFPGARVDRTVKHGELWAEDFSAGSPLSDMLEDGA